MKLARLKIFKNLFREGFQAEITLKGEESYLHSLEVSLQNLKAELEQSSQVQRQLMQMQQEVRDFNLDLVS